MAKTSPSAKRYLISRQQLSYLLDVDVRTLTQWQNIDIHPLPVEVKGRRGTPHQYDSRAVVAWYVRRQINKLTRDDDGKILDPIAEKTRLDAARANLAEHDLAVKRGQFAPIEDMGTAWMAMTSAFRSGVLSIPGKLAPILAAETDRQKVKQILDEEIEEALNELSTHRFEVTGEPG